MLAARESHRHGARTLEGHASETLARGKLRKVAAGDDKRESIPVAVSFRDLGSHLDTAARATDILLNGRFQKAVAALCVAEGLSLTLGKEWR